MKERQLPHQGIDIITGRLDILIECLLASMLLFMPLAFGAINAWSEEVVIGLSGVIVVCFLLKLVIDRGQGIIRSWTYVPIVLFLLVVVFQLIRLPAGVAAIISPYTVNLRTELLGDLPGAERMLKSMTLSFYPTATKHDLRLGLAIAGVFVVVVNVFRSPRQIKRLLVIIVTIGAVISVLALAQNFFGNGKIYWIVPDRAGGAYSGPFLNHSHYGQFMNLCIGAAIALVCVKLREDFSDKHLSGTVIIEYFGGAKAKLLWLLCAMVAIGVASVFASLTRGGMLSMLVAAGFTGFMLSRRKSLNGSGWIMVVMALIAFSCVLYVGFDAAYDRLATLRDFHEAECGRSQILKDIGVAWTKFPVLGTGFGTHIVVYPMFDRSTITAVATHAENEYAQMLEETGMIGLGLLIVFGVMIWLKYSRCVKVNKPICSAAYGLGFGLLAILVHSLSDFGQHRPANGFLSAVFCGLMVSLARQCPDRAGKIKTEAVLVKSRYLRLVIFLGVVGIWTWSLVEANDFRNAESHWQRRLTLEKQIIANNWKGSKAEYDELISCAAAAAACQPDNVKYQHWLGVYRWRSISQNTDPRTGEAVIAEDTKPIVYDIVEQLHKAIELCPTYGVSYSVAGQIEKFVLNDPSGAARIRKGFELAPCNPVVCFSAACLDVSEGNEQGYVEKFAKAVKLNEELFTDVVKIYVLGLSRPHLAMSLAGDDVSKLYYVSGVLDEMQYYDLAEQTRRKLQKLLEMKCSQPETTASLHVLLSKTYLKQGNEQAAIESYRRALALNYGQINWRLQLAKLLAKNQQIPEAIQEARICLRLRPQLKTAQKLIADLSVHRGSYKLNKEISTQ